MGRLICFLIIFAIFLAFIGFNLENNCDVNFGFYIFTNIPIYITALVSFFLGMLCTIPILIGVKEKKDGKPGKAKPVKHKKKNKSSDSQLEELPKENGPYGID